MCTNKPDKNQGKNQNFMLVTKPDPKEGSRGFRFFKTADFDLMSIPLARNPLICIRNILRYWLRIWNGKQKNNGIEKILNRI